MYSEIGMLRSFFLILAFWFLVVPFLSKAKDHDRAVVTVFTALISFRYFIWRFVQTVLPFKGTASETFWVYAVYFFELMAFAEVCIFLLIMTRTNNRSKEADEYEKDCSRLPSVDVFIPTYNEGLDVLEKTIFGAKHLDYPDFKVWVLDDSRREWLRDFCRDNEIGYLTRPDNLHAKAGNINNGLKHTSGELFAIFDADFVPCRNFLRRTVGFFTHNEDIGLVQTPQHFFNRDPIQLNLGLEKLLPDEQRLFFDSMAPSRDSWGAAFCCGSCSIARRKAVEKVGGIPTSSITEDLLTTLCLLTVKYRTVYLNEALSHGMSSESINGYFIQRGRWCRGGIQCFFVPEGPLRAKGLTFLQRVLFSPYSWIIQPVTRFMMLAVPLVYLWFNYVPLHLANSRELVAFQMPLFLVYFLAMRWLTGKKYVPLLSSAVNIFGLFRLLPVMLSSLIKPFGVPFRVTPKGSASHTGIDWYVLIAAGTMMVLTLIGLVLNLIPEYRIITHVEFFNYVVFWGSLNIFLLAFALLLCYDVPRRRQEERFPVQETILFHGKPAILEELSLTGGKIHLSAEEQNVPVGSSVSLEIPEITGKVTGIALGLDENWHFILRFTDLLPKQREDIIVKLFTGKYDNEIHEAGSSQDLFKALLLRAFGKEKR